MVNVVVALLATLAAFGCGGLLVARTLPERHAYLIDWSLTLLALGLTLGAMTVGFASGFSPALLRAMVLGGSLVTPLALALGLVELVARTVPARFAARLIAASYVIVAVVIILLDPITGTFGKSLPEVTGHYSSLPGLVLDGAHAFTIVSIISCAVVTAVRANRRDHQATGMMRTLAFVALAGVLVVVVMRGFMPGPLAPLALGGTVALVWFGASRVLPERAYDDEDEYEQYPEEEPYDEMSYYAGDPQQGRQPQGPPPNQFHHDGPYAAPQPSSPPPGGAVPGPPGQYGRITMYTLIDGHGDAFDRIAAEVTRAVRENEPGTLVHACHSVDNSPAQRIFYQLFRDAAAVEAHMRQPHIQRFAAEARSHVAGTNVIELTVNAGAIIPLPDQYGPQPPEQPRPDVPRQRPDAPLRPDPRRPDLRHQDPRHQDPRQPDPRQRDPRQPAPRQPDPRQPDPRRDPRRPDGRPHDPRRPDPRYQDPGRPDPRQPDPRHQDPRRPEPRHADPRRPDGYRPDRPDSYRPDARRPDPRRPDVPPQGGGPGPDGRGGDPAVRWPHG